MKRCPECEFIYEDNQRLCDMDGTSLVFDIRPLPGGQATQNTGESGPGSSHTLVSVVGILLGVVLLAVGYASFERAASPKSDQPLLTTVTVNQTSPLQPTSPEPPAAETPSETPPDTVTENAGVAERGSADLVESTVEQPRSDATLPVMLPNMMAREDLIITSKSSVVTKRAPVTSIPALPEIKPLPRLKPLPLLPAQKVVKNSTGHTTIQKPAGASQKKDSRSGSLLKKTGRILTKPFKD